MVRYARAKGSKASNEKLPEDATPWQEMKKQMFDAQQPKVEPIENVNDFLKKDNSNEDITWAQFEDIKPKKHAEKEKQKKKRKVQQNDTSVNDVNVGEVDAESVTSPPKKIKKEKKKKKVQQWSINDINEGEVDADSVTSPPKNLKKEKKMQKVQQNDTSVNDVNEGEVDAEFVTCPPKDIKKNTTGRKSTQLKGNQLEEEDRSLRNGFKGNFTRKEKFHNRNQEQNQLHGRRQSRDTFSIRVGHREIMLRYYGGFPVRLEDWERLNELEKKLREENIPEEQIMATMKLQRRRAEKALSRERKTVCFHCREPGHLLSECPENREAQFRKKDSTMQDSATTGMCFKCGSLEHTHFECKVVKDDSYKFAKCFVCHEQGHISRQCPDNPRGLYPKGGGCSECGDVTHFKRDCPKYQKAKQEITLTVPTLKQSGDLEALDGDIVKATKETPKGLKKSKKKVIKF